MGPSSCKQTIEQNIKQTTMLDKVIDLITVHTALLTVHDDVMIRTRLQPLPLIATAILLNSSVSAVKGHSYLQMNFCDS